jgi:hypothetical protein
MISISISLTLCSEFSFGKNKQKLAIQHGTMHFCMEEGTLLSKNKSGKGARLDLCRSRFLSADRGAGSCKNNKSAIMESNVRISVLTSTTAAGYSSLAAPSSATFNAFSRFCSLIFCSNLPPSRRDFSNSVCPFFTLLLASFRDTAISEEAAGGFLDAYGSVATSK